MGIGRRRESLRYCVRSPLVFDKLTRTSGTSRNTAGFGGGAAACSSLWPPLKKKKYTAHKVNAQDDERIVNDLVPRDAAAHIVHSLTDHVWNKEPERHRAQNEEDPGQDRPFVRLEVPCEFS